MFNAAKTLLAKATSVGTRSVLFGAHCWFIHPFFVAAAWTRLYGFPKDHRLWAAFFVHDLGYLGKPNMDGPEGESHVEWGAEFMHRLFDLGYKTEIVPVAPDDIWTRSKYLMDGYTWDFRFSTENGRATTTSNLTKKVKRTEWRDFSLYHSRFYAKRDGKPFSRLCVADKLSVALEPWWLYLPRVWASGELWEYMALAGGKNNSKYKGEPNSKYVSMHLQTGSVRGWHRAMTQYLRDWVEEHKDGRQDTWTPEPAREATHA